MGGRNHDIFSMTRPSAGSAALRRADRELQGASFEGNLSDSGRASAAALLWLGLEPTSMPMPDGGLLIQSSSRILTYSNEFTGEKNSPVQTWGCLSAGRLFNVKAEASQSSRNGAKVLYFTARGLRTGKRHESH
jgi:hypothetical protein